MFLGIAFAAASLAQSTDSWIAYDGGAGPGAGKRVVLISGDEEYRSEEALPQLAKILAERHGFQTTVLFAIDPQTGIVNPDVNDNIPGLEALRTADLMIIATRWRQLPDEQMRHIDDYLRQGKPVIGLRTSTHAFAAPAAAHRKVREHLGAQGRAKREGRPAPAPPAVSDAEWGPYGHYGDGYFGPRKAWEDGFGKLVIGERWVAHHGRHKHESTRGIIAPDARRHPVLNGIEDGDIWGATDVYTVRLPLPRDSKPLVLGQVMARRGEYDESDPLFGMRPDDGPPVAAKNDPMMPVAWTKTYEMPGGKRGRVFATTMGAATDLLSEGVRRLIVNGVYWALGLESRIPAAGANADLVEPFQPSQYGAYPSEYWVEKALRPIDLR